MRLRLSDKLNAMKLSKQYKKDFDAYRREVETTGEEDTFSDTGVGHLSAPGRALCEKYDLPYPFSPYDEDYAYHTEDCPEGGIIHGERGYGLAVLLEGSKVKVQNGRLVFTISVDPARADKDVINDFLYLYRTLRLISGHTRTKGGSMMVDPWQALKMVQEGHSKADIRRRLFGETGPSYDDRTMALYRQVERAVKKGQTMLEEFENPTRTPRRKMNV